MELNQFRDVDVVLDKANDNIFQKQFVSAGDKDGRSLTVQLTDNGVIGEIIGATLNLYWHNEASGLTDLSAFYIVDRATSVFKIDYPQNMLTPGKVIAYIQILHGGKVTHTKPFEITVQKLAGTTRGVLATAEYGALVTTLAKANEFETDIAEVTAQLAHKAEQTALNVEKARIDSFTTLASGSTTGDAELIDGRVGADGTTYANIGGAIRGQLSNLSDDLSNFKNGAVTLHPIYQQGSYDTTTKTEIISTNRIMSDYIFFKQGETVTLKCDTGYSARLLVFDTNKNFVAATIWSGELTFDDTSFNVYTDFYLRLNGKKNDDTSLSVSDGSKFKLNYSKSVYVKNDDIDSAIESIRNKVDSKIGKNKCDSTLITNNSIFDASGSIVSSTYWGLSGLIDVSSHQGEKIICNKFTSAPTRYSCFYASDGTKIPVAMTEQALTIPANAVSCRIGIYKVSSLDSDLENVQIEIGNSSTQYEAFNPISGYVVGNSSGSNEYEPPYYFVNGLDDNKSDFRYDSASRVQDVYDWHDELLNVFPQTITRTQIGTSTAPTGIYATIDNSTYPIYAYEIKGKNAGNNNKFIIAGGIHGDEAGGDGIQGVVASAYFIKDMLYNGDKNKFLEFIKYNCNVIVVPILNPWGYQNGKRCNGNGIDLNRNFDINFVPNGTSYGYSTGTSAFSENESLAFKDYINTNHLDAKFMCEIHTRGGETLLQDDRWMFVYNADRTVNKLTDVLFKAADKMISVYGGTMGTIGETASNLTGCFAYFDSVKNLPSYEPEFFKSVNMNISTLNKQSVMIQCTHFLGTQIQMLVDQFFL